MSKILGLDVGTKKIGVAVGDTDTGFAFTRPAWLINSWSDAKSLLERIIQHDKITTIIAGWPLNTDGSAGPQVKIVDEFLMAVSSGLSVPIVKQDERFSTQAVQREHVGQKMKRGEEDSRVAQLLVESYLQHHRD